MRQEVLHSHHRAVCALQIRPTNSYYSYIWALATNVTRVNKSPSHSHLMQSMIPTHAMICFCCHWKKCIPSVLVIWLFYKCVWAWMKGWVLSSVTSDFRGDSGLKTELASSSHCLWRTSYRELKNNFIISNTWCLLIILLSSQILTSGFTQPWQNVQWKSFANKQTISCQKLELRKSWDACFCLRVKL